MKLDRIYAQEDFIPGVCIALGKDGTCWRILKVNEDSQTMLVIADREICMKAYHNIWEEITWENCSLRQWLNVAYYEENFSEEEKEAILECDIKTPDNIECHTNGGNDTKDRIWLLSIDEAWTYFKDDQDRSTGSRWWLRSPGYLQSYPAFVFGEGLVSDHVYYADEAYGVRPVLLLDLNSSILHRDGT